MKKLKKGLLGLPLLLLIVICLVFAIPQRSINASAEGATIALTSSVSSFKTNDEGKEFVVTATADNDTGNPLYGGQVTVVFDTNYFEYVDFISSTDISNSYKGRSDVAAGQIVIMGDNNNLAITAKTFKLGGIKLRVKSGITSGTVTEAIKCVGCKMPDMNGTDVKPTVPNPSISISFSEPSNECEMSKLSVNGVAASTTPGSKAFTYNAPYTYEKLTGVVPTVSEGATVTYAPALNSALQVGTNTVTITVTAEDKSTYNTYTLTINRAAAETENKLTSLVFKIKDGATLLTKTEAELTASGTFDAGEVAYADMKNLRIESTKKGNFSIGRIILDGDQLGNDVVISDTVNADVDSIQTDGSHTLTVKVIAQNGAFNEYTIKFTISAAQSDNTLSSLTLQIVGGSVVNFTPTFTPDQDTYSASVPAKTEKVKVTATAAGSLASVTYSVPSQEYSVPSTIEVTVTAQDGNSKKYTIYVTEEKDLSGATLSDVKVIVIDTEGEEHDRPIMPTSVEDYFTVTIPFTLNIVKYRIEAVEPSGYEVQGVNFDIPVPNETRTNFTHSVYFRLGGVHEKTITYDFMFESNVKTLAELYCNGQKVDISTGKNFFLIEVDKDVDRALIQLSATDKNATVTVESLLEDNIEAVKPGDREIKLGSGITPIMITVKPNPDVEGMYVLCVKRPVGVKILQSLKCGDEDISVEDNTKIYEVKVDANTDKLKVTADGIEGATVFIDYANVEDVVSEGEKTVILDGESTIVPVKVTAADGSVGMYILKVTRELPGVSTMPYVVAIVVISLIAVLVIIALTVVIVVNRRRS